VERGREGGVGKTYLEMDKNAIDLFNAKRQHDLAQSDERLRQLANREQDNSFATYKPLQQFHFGPGHSMETAAQHLLEDTIGPVAIMANAYYRDTHNLEAGDMKIANRALKGGGQARNHFNRFMPVVLYAITN
jgi:hypothetical protein